MRVQVHLGKTDDEFHATARGGGNLDAWLDFYHQSGQIEFFVPWARCIEVGETLLRAGMDMLTLARERREKEAESCPTPPAF